MPEHDWKHKFSYSSRRPRYSLVIATVYFVVQPRRIRVQPITTLKAFVISASDQNKPCKAVRKPIKFMTHDGRRDKNQYHKELPKYPSRTTTFSPPFSDNSGTTGRLHCKQGVTSSLVESVSRLFIATSDPCRE